jgi:hypothetical protein
MNKADELRAMSVEELRDIVMKNCGVENPWYGDPVAMAVDALIIVSREKGAESKETSILAQSYLSSAVSNPLVTLPKDYLIVPVAAFPSLIAQREREEWERKFGNSGTVAKKIPVAKKSNRNGR